MKLRGSRLSLLNLSVRVVEVLGSGICLWLAIWMILDTRPDVSRLYVYLAVCGGLVAPVSAYMLLFEALPEGGWRPPLHRLVAPCLDLLGLIMYLAATTALQQATSGPCHHGDNYDRRRSVGDAFRPIESWLPRPLLFVRDAGPNPPCSITDGWFAVGLVTLASLSWSLCFSLARSMQSLNSRMIDNYNARVGPDQPQAHELVDYAGANGPWAQQHWDRHRLPATPETGVVTSGISRERYEREVENDRLEAQQEAMDGGSGVDEAKGLLPHGSEQLAPDWFGRSGMEPVYTPMEQQK